MTVSPSLSAKAEMLMERFGLSYERLLGFRFAVNVFIAGAIVWFTLRQIGDSSPAWALASMVAASDPQPEEARRVFLHRLINVMVGCVVGLCFLMLGHESEWMVPLALAVTVLVSSYLVRIKTMWRQAPITAAVVIAAGIVSHSAKVGIGRGLHKVAEVIFGCVVGMLVSWLMSKVWLVRRPAR
ncbi:MAG: FUSC family protein [Candidatus Korobacteraceae bacterium]